MAAPPSAKEAAIPPGSADWLVGIILRYRSYDCLRVIDSRSGVTQCANELPPPPPKKNSFGWGVRFDLKRAHFFQQKIPSLNYTVSRGTKPTPSSTKAISHYFFVNVLSTVP